MLAVQEEERNDTTFSRGCLFCRQVFTKHRLLFDHMAFDHNFSVGQPDNLVYVRKFLDLIEEKLEALLCLHCEKVFKSRDVLKEHMRKKQHKQLNPRNTVWDQFYLVNYLEFGRNWEDAAREEEEPTTGWDQALCSFSCSCSCSWPCPLPIRMPMLIKMFRLNLEMLSGQTGGENTETWLA